MKSSGIKIEIYIFFYQNISQQILLDMLESV